MQWDLGDFVSALIEPLGYGKNQRRKWYKSQWLPSGLPCCSINYTFHFAVNYCRAINKKMVPCVIILGNMKNKKTNFVDIRWSLHSENFTMW